MHQMLWVIFSMCSQETPLVLGWTCIFWLCIGHQGCQHVVLLKLSGTHASAPCKTLIYSHFDAAGVQVLGLRFTN